MITCAFKEKGAKEEKKEMGREGDEVWKEAARKVLDYGYGSQLQRKTP